MLSLHVWGMQFTLSTVLRLQPDFSSTSTNSTLPRSAARCRGVSCLWNWRHQINALTQTPRSSISQAESKIDSQQEVTLVRKYWTEGKSFNFWVICQFCFRQTRQHMGSLQENQAEVPAGSGKSSCYVPLMYCKPTTCSLPSLLKQGGLDSGLHVSGNPYPYHPLR